MYVGCMLYVYCVYVCLSVCLYDVGCMLYFYCIQYIICVCAVYMCMDGGAYTVPPIPSEVYCTRKYAVISKKMIRAMKKNPAVSEAFVNSHLCELLFSTVKK